MVKEMKTPTHIYEIWYHPYCDWETEERIGVFLDKETAQKECDRINKEYWNKRKPYYLVETRIGHLKMNDAFYNK